MEITFLGFPVGSTRYVEGVKPGDVAHYNCLPGFSTASYSFTNMSCQGNGTWKGDLPVCPRN